MKAAADDGRQETPLERVDRNLEELTGELRVLLVATKLFGAGAGALTAAGGAVVFAALWFSTPLLRRRALEAGPRDRPRRGPEAQSVVRRR